MKISTRGLYGVLAVLDMAIHYSTGNIHKADIARRQGIPEQYLAQLLVTLRRAGIIHSTRGPSGGHALARPPAEISVGEIISLLDGQQKPAEFPVQSAGMTIVGDVLHRAAEASTHILHDATFDQLVE